MINVNILSLLVVMIKHIITGKKRTRHSGDKFAFSVLQQVISGARKLELAQSFYFFTCFCSMWLFTLLKFRFCAFGNKVLISLPKPG